MELRVVRGAQTESYRGGINVEAVPRTSRVLHPAKGSAVEIVYTDMIVASVKPKTDMPWFHLMFTKEELEQMLAALNNDLGQDQLAKTTSTIRKPNGPLTYTVEKGG